MSNLHTNTPWHVGSSGPNKRNREIFDAKGMLIADCRTSNKKPAEELANANRIATCVNAHDDLLAALEDAVGFFRQLKYQDSAPLLAPMIAAIAKAKGES